MVKKKLIKPWGYEILVEHNRKYVLKKLFMKKGHRCSLQFHKKKTETIYILNGELKIFYGLKNKKIKSKIFKRDQTITIQAKTIHRMQAIKDSTYLEASTPELSDVIRLQDDYKRT